MYEGMETFFTVRNEVAKVMFLHVSVCPQRGVPGPRGGLSWGDAWSGGLLPRRCLVPGGLV